MHRAPLSLRFVLPVAGLIMVGLLLAVGWTRPAGAATPIHGPITPCATPFWQVVPSPNLGAYYNNLYGIDSVSPTDLWAVGDAYVSSQSRNLIQRWDGASWQIVPSPNASGANSLQSVSVLSANDVWAVGFQGASFYDQTLTMHWDGAAWTIIPSPNVSGNSALYGVKAIAPNDVWAVGQSDQGTLTLHWNGTAWTVVPSPSPGGAYDGLVGVTANGPNDVWAVGSYGFTERTLILRWNGAQWSQVPSPNVGAYPNILTAVTTIAANDAWTVGYYEDSGSYYHSLTLHWDGTTWNRVNSPLAGARPGEAPDTYGPRLYGVDAIASDDVWAVGHNYQASNTRVFVIHWDGTAWTQSPALNPSTYFNELRGIAVVRSIDVWAVGAYMPGSTYDRTLIEHYAPPPCGTPLPTNTPTHTPTWTPTPAPTNTPTNTPTWTPTTIAVNTPTNTPPNTPTNPPTQTPTGTIVLPSITPSPTPCTIQFTDVDLNNPFYTYIRCLACRQIISGYADGTFRWQNDVTRAQVSKMVANAAGFRDGINSAQQTFSDVPASAPFWIFIERLARRGLINGYDCGAPGEPCGPQNRPYFRPNNSVTRGQLAKINAGAAGYQDPIPATQQTFADVAPASPFWLWIEQVYLHGVINGYDCGGPGEPCDPANRPYFRAYSPATRGQTAKIVANTFFPVGCLPLYQSRMQP